METSKQQTRPPAEIQPAFRNLDIGQLVQGKTLTVGNLLDWQRTVIQAVENAKSGGAPISLIPVTTTFQPANAMKPIAPLKVPAQTGPPMGTTSVPVIKATNSERITVPESKPLTTVINNNFSGQNMTGTVLNSMMHSVTSLMQQPSETPAKSPTSPQGLSMIVSSKLPAVVKQPPVVSTSNQQVTTNVTDTPIASTELTQNASPAPSKSSLFKLSGRTLVTILPSGSGEGKNNSSHKVFGDDAFTPIDSFGAGAFEAGSPSSGDAKVTEKITLSPKESVPCSRARNESTESNSNKNNNNSTPSQSVKVKQENDSVDCSGAPSTSKKGKISSRGRNIKNTAVVYTETSDYEDDDVFLHTTYKQQKSSKSKRSARHTATTTATAATNDASESDQEVNDILLYSIHMTNSGTWFHQIMWDGQRIMVMVPSKDDPYFTPPKDDPPVAFEDEPSASYSSLWKGYTVLGEIRAKLFSSYSTAAVVSFRYRSGMESVKVPLLWVPILRNLGSLQESGHSAKVIRMDHLKYLCKHYDLKFLDELNYVCQNKLKDTNNRTVIELNDSKSDDLDYDKIPLCDFFIDRGSKKRKKAMQSSAPSTTQVQTQTPVRKYSRTSDDRSPSRQKSACMECQAVFYADILTCTYCDSELKKITPDQAKNCLNCGEMIRKRCRKCPFCHYNYGIFTFGRWLCNNCSRCNTARTPACLGCGLEKPGSNYSMDELPTPTTTKPSRSASKASTSSSQPSPTRATVADAATNGTRSPPSRLSVESSPAPPPRKRPRRGIMSVDLPPATSNVEEVTPMEVTAKNETIADDVHLCRNLKWGSDEISVAVKVDGQCLMCFPEICEKIVLDHSYELLTKKLTNLKIQLIDGSDILKETTHIHDTPSQTCQLIRYQDLLAVLKHFNYKVPESFERAITSLENEAYQAELKNDMQKSQVSSSPGEEYSDDKELLECMTALQQAVDPKQLCELVTTSLNKSNVLLNKVVAAMDGLDGELEGIQKQQSGKRSLCEVLSSEIGFLKRRSLNIMEAIVQLDQLEIEKKKQN